jgi:spore coat protein U domain-containing protein, fimbrial subunit CupE1/2/3/6
MFRKLAIAVAATALAGNVVTALAGSATSNLSVTASVAQNCSISTSPVAFGAYDPVSTNSAAGVDLTAIGAVSVTCTKNSTGVNITLGLGAHASGAVRRLLGGTSAEFLTYELYHASATTPAAGCTFPGTTVWGTAGAGIFTPTGITGWGANSAKSFNVCGTITKAQDVSADPSYTDTVVATVNF